MSDAKMKVQLLAHTRVDAVGVFMPETWPDEQEVGDMDALAEYAGRSCYESFHRPNPATAKNDDYLAHILDSNHVSVLEHASASFYITGVSRTLTHELVRHRHLSPSQRSQRYVDEGDALLVVPVDLTVSQTLTDRLRAHHEASLELYGEAVDELTARGLPRKAARGAARAFLLNATETRIVMSGNLRAWRDFLGKRWHVAAEAEIQQLAGLILGQLRLIAENAVQDIPSEPFGS